MLQSRKNAGRALRTGTAAALAVCLLAGSAPVLADDSAYRTTTVERGTISVEAQANVSYEYTARTAIRYETDCGSAKFVRYLVERYDYVVQGQPIAEIETGVDEIAVKELELELQRAEEARDEFYKSMDERLESAENAVKESAGTQKAIARLRLEELELELERSKASADEGVEALREQLAAYETAAVTTRILAPASGMVGWINRYITGDALYDNTVLGEIYGYEDILYYVPDAGGVLRYGMKVTLQDATKKTYPGTVVSCPGKYLSANFETEGAYIRLNRPPEAWNDMTAAYETIRIEDVLLVSAAAVKSDKDGSYVVELKDGKLAKRYFTAGKTVKDICYAVDGLTEGMTVVIQ